MLRGPIGAAVARSHFGRNFFPISWSQRGMSRINASGSASVLISISRSSQPCTRSQARSCSDGASSIHQKSDSGFNASVLSIDQTAGSTRPRTAHLGSSSGAPAARNARRTPSGHPVRARLDNQRHWNLLVTASRNSTHPGASSNPSKTPAFRRRKSTPSRSMKRRERSLVRKVDPCRVLERGRSDRNVLEEPYEPCVGAFGAQGRLWKPLNGAHRPRAVTVQVEGGQSWPDSRPIRPKRSRRSHRSLPSYRHISQSPWGRRKACESRWPLRRIPGGLHLLDHPAS